MECSIKPVRRFIVKSSQPVAIPGSANRDLTEYSLKQNFFDPNKASPPNSWNSRLLSRLENYDNRDFNLMME
jgi:hypothetical protein|tara:strand:+ start:35 stop:250 length:216 start_codon:yes stop_codon:yes gene_type:complete